MKWSPEEVAEKSKALQDMVDACFVTVGQAADLLGVSKVCIYKKIYKSEIVAAKWQDVYLIDRYSLEVLQAEE